MDHHVRRPVLSAHVVVDDSADDDGPTLDALGACLAGHFDVEHCTFQLEPAGHRDHEAARCVDPAEAASPTSATD